MLLWVFFTEEGGNSYVATNIRSPFGGLHACDIFKLFLSLIRFILKEKALREVKLFIYGYTAILAELAFESRSLSSTS